MREAFIFDHVRTPRGRGKPDGALHDVTTLALAAHIAGKYVVALKIGGSAAGAAAEGGCLLAAEGGGAVFAAA